MQKRQEAFLSALIVNPDLALNVEHFSWTLLLLDSNRRTVLGPDPFAINQSVSLDAESPFNKIWDVFTSLTNVKTLDLAWLTRDLATPLIDSIPPTLFPAATSVRLAGVMPYALPASILLTNPQKLLHLDLDNLQESGITSSIHVDEDSEVHHGNPSMEPCDNHAQTNETLRKIDETLLRIKKERNRVKQVSRLVFRNCFKDLNNTEIETLADLACNGLPATGNFRQIRAPPTNSSRHTQSRPIYYNNNNSHLAPIRAPATTHPHQYPPPNATQTTQPFYNNNLPNTIITTPSSTPSSQTPGPIRNLLTALTNRTPSLRTLSLRKPGPRDRFDYPPDALSLEPALYAEWALFLSSVKPSLESLTLEQGERLLPKTEEAAMRVRPMDQMFGEVVLPVLVSGGWGEGLKQVVVKGWQGWEREDVGGRGRRVFVDGGEALRGMFAGGVEVEVCRAGRTADHLGVGYG